MPRKSTKPSAIVIGSGCKLEALVPIDERGQIVLPKELREKASIKAGDKLAVVTCEKDGRICCITFVKADEFKDTIKKTFGPMLEELTR
ncbi:MAG: HgcAB-associated protein HgcC [Candidatus Bathyarchaeia archaeon]|jgi:AbrB family looped-hinge helix DNA binding protein|nr:AbrB/MazE/SpoVT family DNA-binding domain-containing protein [Candidatus Bathyarchaeota archaeon A05DMB-4]MDH7596037.1 HgcAB-associated protein [Candidatus Bathyarchaeota archaeon]